jgi:hypothetical protein
MILESSDRLMTAPRASGLLPSRIHSAGSGQGASSASAMRVEAEGAV